MGNELLAEAGHPWLPRASFTEGARVRSAVGAAGHRLPTAHRRLSPDQDIAFLGT